MKIELKWKLNKQNSEPKKVVKPLILKEKDTVSKKVINQPVIPKKE